MEAVKGVVFDRGEKEVNGQKVHSYLVSFVLVTDQPLEGIKRGETIIMGVQPATNLLTDALDTTKKYKPPYSLGDVSNAVMSASNFDPKDLEKIK